MNAREIGWILLVLGLGALAAIAYVLLKQHRAVQVAPPGLESTEHAARDSDLCVPNADVVAHRDAVSAAPPATTESAGTGTASRRTELWIAGKKFFEEVSATTRRVYLDSGELWVEIPLVDGKQDGTWKYWYKNGEPQAVVTFVADNEEGLATYYHDSGQKQAEGSYLHGCRDGVWRSWYDDGSRESEGTFRAYSRDDGKWASEKVGRWSYWNRDGTEELLNSGLYVHGVRQRT